MYFDWHRFRLAQYEAPVVVDPRRRLRACLAGFVVLLAVVFTRIVQLEWTAGAAFRQQAANPLTRRVPIAGVRGRILTGDGAVLAQDRRVSALAVHYRTLQEPCDPTWLRLTARGHLIASQRKQPECVAAEEQRILKQRAEMTSRLCRLCGLSNSRWEARRRQIQDHVEQIAETVNRRHAETVVNSPAATSSESSADPSWRGFFLGTLKASVQSAEPTRVVVAEERQYHVMMEEVPPAVVAEIGARPQLYPGVTIVARRQRVYPEGMLAAHLLGYVGLSEQPAAIDTDHADRGCLEFVGRSGLEKLYESQLQGHPGESLELLDHGGRLLATQRVTEPGTGRDLILTLDSRVQRVAETLLDQALRRRTVTQLAGDTPLGGGAAVVLDVHSGALLVAASAPRFDLACFAQGASAPIAAVLADPDHPLFDRVAAMAIAPGSVFKIVTSIALLESGSFDPQASFECRGYLDTPDRWRCATFVRHGRGHGAVTLADALAQSCNVYFFDHARRLGPAPLLDWSRRLGFGQLTGIDLPQEVRGSLPVPPVPSSQWHTADTLQLCIGQGTLTATPLQIARLLAAVANGGHLVAPHVVSAGNGPSVASDIPGLHPRTLAAVREGLERAVADPRGTAHDTLSLDSVSVAGKTGTAQTGIDQPDHAWFAGYVPADQPRYAVVVVLEHAGDAAAAACPLAKRLILQMQALGIL